MELAQFLPERNGKRALADHPKYVNAVDTVWGERAHRTWRSPVRIAEASCGACPWMPRPAPSTIADQWVLHSFG
jgi:hypothetical protein